MSLTNTCGHRATSFFSFIFPLFKFYNKSMGVTSQGMNVGALRYPGGEKADNYLWAAGPGFEGPPCPQPSRISATDWPANDPLFYDLAARRWLGPVMDFDDFMSVASHPKLNAEPYLVVNVRARLPHAVAVRV
jgi:alpha-L-arabinofuranosidase